MFCKFQTQISNPLTAALRTILQLGVITDLLLLSVGGEQVVLAGFLSCAAERGEDSLPGTSPQHCSTERTQQAVKWDFFSN